MNDEDVYVRHKFSVHDLESWHADLLVTHECGMGCKFCIDGFVDTSDNITDIKDIEDYLKFLAEVERKEHPDMTSVLLLGGEPTKVSFDYLKRVCDLIHHYGFNTTMTTNGSAGSKLLELDGYVDFINISHYGRKAIIDKEYLYKFKYSEITLSKLITNDYFPTFDSFKEFVSEAKTCKLNYRFSTLQENTPNLDKMHPSWVDSELLPNCKITPVLECLNAAEYEGYIIKVMHYHNENKGVTFPPYPHLYPNGNVNRDFSDEEYSIEYRRRYKKSKDIKKDVLNELDFSSRNHWLERSYANFKSGIDNPIYARVLAENDTMLLMTINKCFAPGTVSIASKEFHLSTLEYSDKEKEDLLEMMNRVSNFLESKFGYRPLVSEHSNNHYNFIKNELSKFSEAVIEEDRGKFFDMLSDVWSNIIKNDSGVHSHTLLIPCKLSKKEILKIAKDMKLKKIKDYSCVFKSDINKKFDLVGSNDGEFYLGNDDEGSHYHKAVLVRHMVAHKNGIAYLPSRPKENLKLYYPIIRETIELFKDFKYEDWG